MYPSITVTKNSKFFIAMCKDVNSVHSFISLGVEIDNKQVLLGSFGKIIRNRGSSCRFLFAETEGRITNERIFFTKKNEKIRSEMTYKAYSLSWQQYMEFLAYMREISLLQNTLSPLEAYCPTEETDTQVILKWQSVEQPMVLDHAAENHDHLDEYQRIGLSNTCRHAAINLTKQACHLPDLGQGVSSSFAAGLPLTTRVVGGVLGQNGEHIYILPLPPRSFPDLCDRKRAIITKLYERMDEILLNEHNKKCTIEKFEKIKALYESITSHENASLSEIFYEISCWIEANKTLISTHRKSHWISFPTTTEKLFTKLLEENRTFQITPGQSAPPGHTS